MTVPHVALIILDGWGLAEPGEGNAVSLADTPVFDELWTTKPHTTLTAMGESVGLPAGQMGNSEVGHLNLGAGAIVPQDLARIDAAVEDGSLAENEVLQAAIKDAPRVHLIGLVSDGGVHASDRHLKALLDIIDGDVVVHAFTDGRDTSPHGGASYLKEVEGWGARIGTVVGRYFAMDRDQRWDRTEKALDLLVEGKASHHADTAEEAARAAYERGETDEFIEPTTIGDDARIRPEDSVIAFNFRPDRMRQITEKLAPLVDRLHHPRRVRRGLGPSRHLPAQATGGDARAGHLRRREGPAARGRDGEVPPRHVLLQRRRGASVQGRGARAGAVAARRPDLRPQARDERARGRPRLRRSL